MGETGDCLLTSLQSIMRKMDMVFDVFSNKNALLPVTSEGFNNRNFQNDQISLKCRIPKPQIILLLLVFIFWFFFSFFGARTVL